MAGQHKPQRVEDPVLSGQQCPYCGKATEYIDSERIYGRSYGMVYACLPCDAWVGVHYGTNIAKGRLANAELRDAKKKAHELFDCLWLKKMQLYQVTKHEARTSAYKWLAKEMGLPGELTHIGMFDVAQCEKVIAACLRYYQPSIAQVK